MPRAEASIFRGTDLSLLSLNILNTAARNLQLVGVLTRGHLTVTPYPYPSGGSAFFITTFAGPSSWLWASQLYPYGAAAILNLAPIRALGTGGVTFFGPVTLAG